MAANLRVILMGLACSAAMISNPLPVIGQSLAAEAAFDRKLSQEETTLPAKLLKVGDAFVLSLRQGQKIFISRKGYLAVHQLSPERFRLIALKKGELVVLVKDRSNRVLSQQTVIVRTRKPPAKVKPLRLPHDCSSPALHCDGGSPPSIRGVAKSWQQFFSLRAWCKTTGCQFGLRLSRAARSQYEAFVRAHLVDWYDYKVLANGVLVFCPSKAKATPNPAVPNEKALRNILDADMWQLPITVGRCAKPRGLPNYLAEAVAFRLKTEEAKRVGLNLAGQPLLLDPRANIKLHAFLADNQSLIVGHPAMRLVAGEQSEFATGSEWYVAQGEEQGQWKQVGFTLRLKVEPHARGTVRVGYQVEITGPRGEGARQLDRSYMASTLVTSLGSAQVVAQLNTAMTADSKREIPILNTIPILGPLLRHKVSTKSESRLFLWLRIQALSPTPSSGAGFGAGSGAGFGAGFGSSRELRSSAGLPQNAARWHPGVRQNVTDSSNPRNTTEGSGSKEVGAMHAADQLLGGGFAEPLRMQPVRNTQQRAANE